jgi:molybdenum cofactor guanylyltransferase
MPERVAGVLLAGGQARRMGGGDKCLVEIAGETLLSRIAARLRPQVGPMVLNVNGDPARFESCGLPVANDVIEGFPGPLAGVLTGLEWARSHAPGCAFVVSVPCDAPFVPRDLVARLVAARAAADADMACAASGGRDHPVFGLWPVALAADLRRALVVEGIRKVDVWTGRYRLVRAEFATDPVDPFFNVNAPEDVAAAERLAARA